MSIFLTSTSTRCLSARRSSACRLRSSVVSESAPPDRWSHSACGRLRRAVATISCNETKFSAARSSMHGYFCADSRAGFALPPFLAISTPIRTYFITRRVMRCGQDGPDARRPRQAICRYGQGGQRSSRPFWPQPKWDGALWAHLFVGSPRNIDILLRDLLLDLHPTSPPSHTCLVMKQVLGHDSSLTADDPHHRCDRRARSPSRGAPRSQRRATAVTWSRCETRGGHPARNPRR